MTRCTFSRFDTKSIRCEVCGTRRRHAGDPNCYVRKCKPSTSPKPRGFGDTLARFLTRLGFKKCPKCEKRQATLNRIVPYRQP